MAFFERRCSRKIIRHWRARRVRMRKAQAAEQRRLRALAKEKARQEQELHVDVVTDDPQSEAAAVSPVRTQLDDESDMSEEEPVASPSDARVGANLTCVCGSRLIFCARNEGPVGQAGYYTVLLSLCLEM